MGRRALGFSSGFAVKVGNEDPGPHRIRACSPEEAELTAWGIVMMNLLDLDFMCGSCSKPEEKLLMRLLTPSDCDESVGYGLEMTLQAVLVGGGFARSQTDLTHQKKPIQIH